MKGRFLARLKQSISALLALVMALALVPMAVLAAGSADWTVVAEDGSATITAKEDGTATFKFKAKPSDADSKTYYIFDKVDTLQYYDFATVTNSTVTLLTGEDGKKTANVSNITLENDVFTATLIDKTQSATLSIGLYDENHADFTINPYQEVQAAPKVTFTLTDAKGATVTAVTNATKAETGDIYTVTDKTKPVTFKLDTAKVATDKKYVPVVTTGKFEDPLVAENEIYSLNVTADVAVNVALNEVPAPKDETVGDVTVSSTKVEDTDVNTITALVTGSDTVGSDKNAAVQVEIEGKDKTLVFNAADDKDGNKVELPQKLTENLASGEAKADVKVNSGVGSVTVPSDALTGAKASVTISVVKKSYTEDEAKKLAFKNDKGVALSDALKNTLTAAIKAVSGLTIEAKAGTENMFKEENAETNKELTITIKVEKAGKYFVLCTSAKDGVTTFSREPFDVKADKDGNCFLKFKSRHLSDAVAVEATDAVTAAVKDLALDKSATEPEKPVETKEIKAEYWTEGLPVGGTPTQSLFGAKLAFTNLEGGAVYVVQLAKQGQYGTAGCVVMTVKADGNGKAVIDVLPSKTGTTYEVMLFKCNSTDGTVSSLKDLDYTTCNGKDGSKAERAIATLTETMPTAG